jgi:hypothetical protein
MAVNGLREIPSVNRKTYIVDGFVGQNSKDLSEKLDKGECQLLQGGFVNEDKSFDADLVGTLSLKTGLTHEPLVICHWKSNDGYEYILTWGSDGIVNYYNKTTDGAVNTSFITGMPVHFPPEFVKFGNEYIIMLAGKHGNYKITSSGGTLAVSAQLDDVPSANFGRINAGALYLAQETSIIHSAANNPTRFTPTREERTSNPPVFDVNQRLILSSAGVQGETMGYEIWKGFHILWTQYDCYIAAWDGAGTAYATKLPGYGLYGLKGWTILNDRLRFFSTFKQGSICSIVTGAVGSGGSTFSVGQNIQISIIEEPGGAKIADVLQACPTPTAGKKIIAIDSKEDWEGAKITPALSTLGFDTTTLPGFVSLKAAVKLTVAPIAANGYILNSSDTFDKIGTLTESATALDNDAAPGPYPALIPTPTIYQMTLALQSSPGCQIAYTNFVRLEAVKSDGSGVAQVVDKDRLSSGIVAGAVWTSYIPSEPIKSVSAVKILFGFHVFYNKTIGGVTYTFEKDIVVVRQYSLSGVYDLQKVYLYKVEGSAGVYGTIGSTFVLDIGEVEIWGFQQSHADITTAILSQAGLAAGVTDLGVFQIGYQGTNDDGTGGLTGATAPTLVEVGIGTDVDPTTWGSAGATRAADVTTAKGSITYMTAAELKIGLKLGDLIRTGGGGGSVAFTFAAGGTLYTRVRVPVTLQGSTFASPLIDRLIWDFYTGTARLSIFPMFTWSHKTILSLLTNSSSTECDKVVVINDNGHCTTMAGVKLMAGTATPDTTIVTAGKTLGKFGEGSDNLIFASAASTDTPTVKTITSPKIKGINRLFARKVKFGVSKFNADSTNITLSGAGGVDEGANPISTKLTLDQNWEQTDHKTVTLGTAINITGKKYLSFPFDVKQYGIDGNGDEYAVEEITWDLKLTVTQVGGSATVYTYVIPTKGMSAQSSYGVRRGYLIDISGIAIADTNATIVLSVNGTTAQSSYKLECYVGNPGGLFPAIVGGPLYIYGTTESGDTLIYTHFDPITDLTYIPEKDQDLRLIQGRWLQAKLTTMGQVKCVGFGLEYDEQEGSL